LFDIHVIFAVDDSGMWLCLPALSGKRLDVQIVGVSRLTGRVSPKVLSTEGQCGHMLVVSAIDPYNKKVTVCGLGKNNALKVDIEKQCVKPLREVDGRCLSLVQEPQRVVIIGPDVLDDRSHVGHYAQTNISLMHAHGPEVVPVKFAAGGSPGFFHQSSLCLSKNVGLTLGANVFPATVFV
jgi:hypothetical protein